jgi:hypothetical protein
MTIAWSTSVSVGQMGFQRAFTDLDRLELGWRAGGNVADFYFRLGGQAANAILRVFVTAGDGSLRFNQDSGKKRCKAKH